MALKTITVFCGSSLGNDPRFEEGAKGTAFLMTVSFKSVAKCVHVLVCSTFRP